MSTVVVEHFSLRREPFSSEIETQALYPYESFRQGKLRLEQALARRGLAVVVGESGSAKSTLVRAVKDRLAPSSYRVLYVAVPGARNPLAPVVEELLTQLGEKVPFNNTPRGMARLRQALLRTYEQGQLPVVVLDDAHGLDAPAWAGLKTLTNYEMDSKTPLCVWLLGAREELLKTLRWRGLAEIRSRLRFCYHLGPVKEEEVEPYLQAHLKWAGCDRPLFPREVARAIHSQAHGLPRCINSLAYGALAAAAYESKELVDLPCVDQAASELLLAAPGDR